MIVRFRRGNMTETRPVHGKLDHHVSAARKRDGYKQRPVSVEFTKYGNTLFRPVQLAKDFRSCFKDVVKVVLEPPLPSISRLLQFCLRISFFTGNYSETVSDAKIAIELQPTFLKAFVRGKI